MEENRSVRIQSAAAKALAEWKEFFAREVSAQAIALAKKSHPPDLVTLSHYRQAAVLAAQSLAIEVQNPEPTNGHQEAA